MTSSVVSCSDEVNVWYVGKTTHRQSASFQSGDSPLNVVQWSHNNQMVSVGGGRGRLALHGTSGVLLRTLPTSPHEDIHDLHFSSSSRYLVTGGSDTVVKIWDLKDDKYIKSLKGHIGCIRSVRFSPREDIVASGSSSGEILLHSVATGRNVANFEGDGVHAIKHIEFSPHRQSILASCSDSGSVSLWDIYSRKRVAVYHRSHASPCSSVAFSPVNRVLLCSTGLDKSIVFYDSAEKKRVTTLQTDAPVHSLSFMNDGSHVIAGTSHGDLLVFDLRVRSRPSQRISAHRRKPVRSLCVERCVKETKRVVPAIHPDVEVERSEKMDSPVTQSQAVDLFSPVGRGDDDLRVKYPPIDELRGRIRASVDDFRFSKKEDETTRVPTAGISSASHDTVSSMFSPLGPPIMFDSTEPLTTDQVIDGSEESDRLKRAEEALKRAEMFLNDQKERRGEESVERVISFEEKRDIEKMRHSHELLMKRSPKIEEPEELYEEELIEEEVKRNVEEEKKSFVEEQMLFRKEEEEKRQKSFRKEEEEKRQKSFRKEEEEEKRQKSFRKEEEEEKRQKSFRKEEEEQKEEKSFIKEEEEKKEKSFIKEEVKVEEEQNELKEEVKPRVEEYRSLKSDIERQASGEGKDHLLKLIQNAVEESLMPFRMTLHEEVQNLHLELLRQFQIQQTEIETLLNGFREQISPLIEEIQRLRKENSKLKHLY